jgi:hypothetical protein
MKTSTTQEISVNDLQAVMDAAKLLRRYGLIGMAKIREVRAKVHEDCCTHIDRYEGCDDLQRACNEVWKQTRPL